MEASFSLLQVNGSVLLPWQPKFFSNLPLKAEHLNSAFPSPPPSPHATHKIWSRLAYWSWRFHKSIEKCTQLRSDHSIQNWVPLRPKRKKQFPDWQWENKVSTLACSCSIRSLSNQDRHKISDKFEFKPDSFSHGVVSQLVRKRGQPMDDSMVYYTISSPCQVSAQMKYLQLRSHFNVNSMPIPIFQILWEPCIEAVQ